MRPTLEGLDYAVRITEYELLVEPMGTTRHQTLTRRLLRLHGRIDRMRSDRVRTSEAR